MDKTTFYEELEKELNEEAKKILLLIKEDYYRYMSEKNRKLVDSLLESNNVVVNHGDSIFKDDTFAHGGRALKDGKIHFYPDVREFLSNEVLLKKCKSLLPHEIFHFFLQPDALIKFDKAEGKKKKMAEAYTEGLVEREARMFCQKHPEIEFERANYGSNISFVNATQTQLQADSYDVIFSENDYLKNIGSYEGYYDSILNNQKQAINATREFLKELPKELKQKYYDNVKTMILQDENLIRDNVDNTKLYNDSIILIGPSGAGKSTVARELSQIMNMPNLSLDPIANKGRALGFMKIFKSVDDYNSCMIKILLEQAKLRGMPGIVDFGAGHSVYNDLNIFKGIKARLSKFKNIVLLLPTPDIEKSLQILSSRSTGDYRPNRKFITSPCNRELSTMTVYENDRTPSEVAMEIIKIIEDRNKEKKEVR